MQKVFLGPEAQQHHDLQDLSVREKIILVPMTVVIIWLGLFPQPIINTVKTPVKQVVESTTQKPVSSIQSVDMKGGTHE
jgi:NADH-quinone oxidoreductase subunit M